VSALAYIQLRGVGVALHRRKPAAIRVKAPSPFIEPALATAINKVPSSERWFHEVKFDGYRVQLYLANETVRVFTRRFPDFMARFRMRFSLGLANAKASCFGSSASAEMRLHQRLLLPRRSS
jgi:ATP-dependent DNA ligase